MTQIDPILVRPPLARRSPVNHTRFLTALAFVGCAIAYLAGNNSVSLFDRDEAWYAQISRTMVQTGDWVVPWFRHQVFDGKPVFAFWCQAISMSIFGQTVFAARFPSVVGGLTVLALVWWAARIFAGPRRAAWTVLVLGSGALYMGLSKLAMVDAELLVWITIAQICLAAIYSGRTSFWIAITLWIAFGFAALTKGPVVIGMLAGTMLALLILDVGSDFLSIKAWLAATRWWWKTQPWMMIIFLPAIMGPWTYLVHKRAPAFISTSVFQNYLRPIFGKPMNHRWTMPGFYLMAIWPSFMPWSLVLPVAVIKAWQNRRLAAVRYCLAATFGPLVVIEMVAQKLPHYLLPMFPAMAFLVADFVVRTVRGQYRELRTRKSKQITIAWSIGLAAIAFAPWLLMLPVFRYPALPYAAMAALTLSGLIAVGVTTRLFVKEQFGPVFLSMGTSSLFILTIVSLTFLPNFAPLCASRRASEAIWQTGFKPEDSVALMSYAEPSITFYLDGAGIDYGGDEYFPATPMSDWPQWIVMTSDRADRMPAMATQQYEPLGSFRSMSLGSKTGSGAVVVMRRK